MKIKHTLTLQLSLFLFVLLLSACNAKKETAAIDPSNPDILHNAEEKLTRVTVYDIFSPPVASRVYSYANIAAYETLLHAHPEYRSLVGQLKGLKELPQPDSTKDINFAIASVHAFLTVGKALIFSEDKIDDYMKELYDSVYASVPEETYNNSIAYGETMGKAVLAYSNADGYKETRGLKYTVLNEPGTWSPTPPAYMDAIEPFWNKIRPFVIDSADQFIPLRPSTYSMDKGSDFYQEMMEVYNTGVNLTEEQRAIASFWDCNPFVMHTVGHVMYATKKITPGGHWMEITSITNKLKNADMMKSVEAYTLVSITLFDGFISCWDEKYRSNVIRPETVINAYIDEDWKPVLQTPPFPEYPSGHSVVSKAASVMLTHLYGENFSFADSSELVYGLPPRNFDSFQQAAEEAAISRLYGGIHYMPAIKYGLKEGESIGNDVVATLNTRKKANKEIASALQKQD